MSLEECGLINLPKIQDMRGNLTFVEGGSHIPFDIRRVFYLYGVPAGLSRGGHALKTCEQFLIAISGSLDVHLDDGREKKKVQLVHSNYGLYIPPTVWRVMDNFSSGAVCMALALQKYAEDDYYRDYTAYTEAMGLK